MSGQGLGAQKRAARRTALGALGVVVLMGGLAFAAVPFYRWFCQVTGFSGTTRRAETSDVAAVDREMLIRFAANTHRDVPWSFEPVRSQMRVKIGEQNLALYRATNHSEKSVTGTATFNVAPLDIGEYFVKIDCFCFTEQTLAPSESVEMPVSFYVDPEILDDPENKHLQTITLSYTFFRQKAQTAAKTE